MNVKNSSKLSCANKRLSNEENDAIFLLLGKGCQSQCTTIAQVFESNNNRWTKLCTGVLCFVKDHTRKSYFCRMFCLILHEIVWEQEIYNEFVMDMLRPFLLEFEGDKRMTALSFYFDDEASDFMNIVTATVNNRNKKRGARRQMTPPPLPAPNFIQSDLNPQQITKIKSSKDKNSKKKKFTKDMIGQPKDFRHEVHVGSDGIRSMIDTDEVRQFLQQAGFDPNKLDHPMRKKVEQFVNMNRASFMPGMNNRTAPPPPKTIPPPLPYRNQETLKRDPRKRPVPPIPSQGPMALRNVSTVKAQGSSTGPTPPPPPPMENIPPPPIPMEMPTKKSTPIPSAPDPRGALLESIRQGRALKKVDVDDKPKVVEQSSEVVGNDQLVNALNAFLKKREDRCRVSSESEEDDEEVEVDSEDWDD